MKYEDRTITLDRAFVRSLPGNIATGISPDDFAKRLRALSPEQKKFYSRLVQSRNLVQGTSKSAFATLLMECLDMAASASQQEIMELTVPAKYPESGAARQYYMYTESKMPVR